MAESTSSGASTEPAQGANATPVERKPRLALLGLGLVAVCALLWLRPFSASVETLGAWQHELATARELARENERPLHVHFSSADAPLAARMDETLSLEPVRRIAGVHFVNLRLDARGQAELFRRFIGSAGALGSCIVDHDVKGELDVVAVAAGYLDAERYVAFLDAARQSLPRLRELRDGERQDAATLLALGELYAAQGSVARARSTFARVTEPESRALALEHLARLDVEAGQTAQARRQLEEAKARPGAASSPRIRLTEALILSSERRVSDAVALLTDGLPADVPGERARGLLLLAQLQHELKRDTEALTELERVRAEWPGSAWSRLADERMLHIKNPEPGHTH